MNAIDVIGTAVSNTFRSKTRSILTILAIFVGAFTLTLTSGLGTGINAYIDDTVSGVGAENAMTVTKVPEGSSGAGHPGQASTGPAEYNPDTVSTGIPGDTVIALTPEDINTLQSVEGVDDVHAVRSIRPDYVRLGDGTPYAVSVGSRVPGQTVLLVTGSEPNSDSSDLELAIPDSYVEPLGFSNADAALGEVVTIGLTDATLATHTVQAKIVGVTEEGLVSPSGPSILPSNVLADELFTLQTTGLPADQVDRYTSATVWFDLNATDEEITALKDRLADGGFTGTTLADQLGIVKSVTDAIVLVLNAFAIIALLAASFGIINTLYMSVQERTREIGLMKAMGMGSGKIFSLFSLEAAFLGFLGSTIAVVLAMLAGSGISSALSTTLLSDLSGLTLIAFDPASIVTIIVIVMGIAFLAGTLPAARAARADPVTSLRYE